MAKARGVKLGATGAWLARRNRAEAQARAKKLAPVIRELQERGLSMRAIATELRKRKVPTPKGGTWHPELVTRGVRKVRATSLRHTATVGFRNRGQDHLFRSV